MCGYGLEVSATLSRSKKRAWGMCACLKTSRPERFCGSLGRNQEPHIGTVRGAVESFVVAFDFKAVARSEGETRYERNVLWARAVPMVKGGLLLKIMVACGRRSSVIVAIVATSDVAFSGGAACCGSWLSLSVCDFENFYLSSVSRTQSAFNRLHMEEKL